MKIDKYISIPKRQKPYISYLQLFLSLSSGVISIIILKIYEKTNKNIFAISPLISISEIIKIVVFINYCIRRQRVKRTSSHSILGNMAKINISDLIIPALIKTMAYFGFILAVLNYQNIIVTICIALNLLLNQFVSLSMKKSRKIKFLSIFLYLIFTISFILTTLSANDGFNFQGWKFHSIAFCLICGWLIPISFFYLHRQIFSVYQPCVDQILSKQYLIETLNFIIISIIYIVGNNQDFILHLQYILDFPLHCILFAIISVIYEISMLQMISKIDFKYVFMIMISGSFWINFYKLIKNQQFNILLLFSTILGLIGLVGLLRVISSKDIAKWIYNLKKNQKEDQN